MNTRLLMELRVEVGAAQEIGAVPGGIRRTVPLAGGTFDGRLRGVVLPGGSADWLLVRAGGRTRTRLPRDTPDRRRRADRDAFLWFAPRTSECDGGPRPRRARGSGSVLLSNH